MADLPVERLSKTAVFESSGLDIFGPYTICDGKNTRRTSSTKKVWVLLCTCLYSRAVHLECLSSMDTPTLHLALRRFFALRGACKRIISDHGSNFIGVKNQLDTQIDIDDLQH